MEINHPQVDIFDKEKYFIDNILINLMKTVPNLRITLEHITTRSVDFVRDNQKLLATSVTPHHLALNRNAIFKNGIRPHYFLSPHFKKRKT